jgi:serine/threonine protein kinase
MERAAVSASQPPPATFRDGLGDRRHIADSTGSGTVELLCLRGDLAAVPSFEFALRERVSRLASFHHAYYGRVRGVERGNDFDQTLTITSDATAGVRLSDLLTKTEDRRVALDINAALCLIRQLVAAVAMLHETARDVAHGALGPERIVITPNARLVVVEYVLGAALEQLRFSQERYWSELRVAVPRSAGLPRFDHRTDVTQIGVVALSLILGRPLREDEFPARVGDVVAATWALSAKGGFEPLPPGLRAWLGRALQLDARGSFPTAVEASIELDKVLGDAELMATPASLEAFLARYAAADRAPARVAPKGPSAPLEISAPPPSVPPPPKAASFVVAPVAAPAPIAPAPSAPLSPPATPAVVVAPPSAEWRTPIVATAPVFQPANIAPVRAPTRADSGLEFQSSMAESIVARPISIKARAPVTARRPVYIEPSPMTEPEPDSEVDQPAGSQTFMWVATAAIVVILAAAGVFASKRMFPPVPAAATTGTLVITTNPAGAQAFVGGQRQGTTPLTLTLTAGSHVVELRGAGEPRSIQVTITAGTEIAQYVDLPKAGAALGQLQVKTDPAGARVMVDGTPRGVSPMLITDLLPGEHAVVVESDLGTAKQTVTVESGMTAALVLVIGAPTTAPPASGWLTVESAVDVQLFENGELLGSSGADRMTIPAGSHEIEVVNEALGYRATQTIQVSAGKVANVQLDLPKGAIALNAAPWAEVWIDGERIGDTPLGNLSLTIGPHEIVFRHPELGEQRHVATITLKNPVRLSVDMRKQ